MAESVFTIPMKSPRIEKRLNQRERRNFSSARSESLQREAMISRCCLIHLIFSFEYGQTTGEAEYVQLHKDRLGFMFCPDACIAENIAYS